MCQTGCDKCQPVPTSCNTCLQPQALVFVAVELYVPFPDFCLANTCVPFKMSLSWNATPVLVLVIAATTFLGTPPAQQLPPCANSLFAFCLSHPDFELLEGSGSFLYVLLISVPRPGSNKDKRCSHKWPPEWCYKGTSPHGLPGPA